MIVLPRPHCLPTVLRTNEMNIINSFFDSYKVASKAQVCTNDESFKRI